VSTTESSSGKTLVWGLFLLMFVLHQDKWWWDDGTLVFGFLPVGLAFHAAFSLVCAALGWLAIKMAWPHDLEAFAETETTATKMEEGSL
jgi:hypothetical protein